MEMLLPLWIICAPLVLIMIDGMRTPKVSDTTRHSSMGGAAIPLTTR